ncbi:Homoserine O-acetyltransferase [Penicillium odoratum]|uniref:Homoserine O-acetyltransferase n=1 Tax=Penicillium odoratum TaxID=1167516 RepID=UPI002549547D|nr:Homoserine O-acetyltransferase [Penicillium odoratum]KAJ5771908.1 Homoserine O-acetyltransferase [Penicillium odoratum]
MPTVLENALEAICLEAKKNGSSMWLDAEQQTLQPGLDEWAIHLMRKHNREERILIYNTIQAYLKGSQANAERHITLATQEGWGLGIKLVRGAYIEHEDRSLIHDTKEDTDDSYNRIAQMFINQEPRTGWKDDLQFPLTVLVLATHNADSVRNAILAHHQRLSAGLPTVVLECAQLQGMADELGCELLHAESMSMSQEVIPRTYKFLTWGSVSECMGYLHRRAIENRGAVERTQHMTTALRNELVIPSFTLESGVTLNNVPVAYTTHGVLSPNGDNVLVICHALTGSADVADWWGPLLGGPGQAFDLSRFFVVCLNSLGSPYGSASPVTYKDGKPENGYYGPEFPLTTIRDDVKIHKMVLDDLGVKQIAAVVGGSMGGMLTLEYAFFGKEYVRSIVPIATSARHSAWCIGWGEAQRQSIYSDSKYDGGHYSFDDPPSTGLGAARMSALLTYRSRDSFESRFGRNVPESIEKANINGTEKLPAHSNEHWTIHNDGHRDGTYRDPQLYGTKTFSNSMPAKTKSVRSHPSPPTLFTTQSYLRYQGEKFVNRFDANCYISLTRKLDTHDVARHRSAKATKDPIHDALSRVEQPTLVLGIESDSLFVLTEQQEIAAGIPDSRFKRIESSEGHDAFLLQVNQVNLHILDFFHEVLPDIMGPGNSNDTFRT